MATIPAFTLKPFHSALFCDLQCGVSELHKRTENYHKYFYITLKKKQPVRDQSKACKLNRKVAEHGITTRISGDVVDGPLAECSAAIAGRGDRNVHLSCRVRCKPPLTALFWIVDDRGTTVSDGQIVGEYWVLLQVSSSYVDTIIGADFSDAVDENAPIKSSMVRRTQKNGEPAFTRWRNCSMGLSV